MKRSAVCIVFFALVLFVPAALFAVEAGGDSVDISGKTYFNQQPVTAMVLANGKYTFSNGTDGSYSLLDVSPDATGKITIQVFCSGLAPMRMSYIPSSDFFIWDAHLKQKNLPDMVLNDVTCQYVTSTLAQVTGSVSYDGTPVTAMVLANGKYAFTNNSEGSFGLVVPLNSQDEVVLQGFCSGLAPYRQTLAPTNEKPKDGFPWAGTYNLKSFIVQYDSGYVLTSENADSFSGSMTIDKDGYCVQDIEVNGGPVTVSGTFKILDADTVLISSGGTSYTAEYLYNGSTLQTTVSSGTVGPFSETDVWERTTVKSGPMGGSSPGEGLTGAIGLKGY